MKKKYAFLLLVAVFFFFSLAGCGSGVGPATPTPTKTPRPASTPTSTPGFPLLVLELFKYNEAEGVATIVVHFGAVTGTYKLEKGQEATLEAIGCEACRIAGVRVWLRLNPVTNRLEYRREEEPEWRGLNEHEPLQL